MVYLERLPSPGCSGYSSSGGRDRRGPDAHRGLTDPRHALTPTHADRLHPTLVLSFILGFLNLQYKDDPYGEKMFAGKTRYVPLKDDHH